MGLVVFILGNSGTGKSYSMRNFNPNELVIINVQGKILPFRNSAKYIVKNTDNYDEIISSMKLADASGKKVIVIDDFQYLMANEFMRRSAERGFDKFTEIARHAWDVVDAVKTLSADTIVYIMCHSNVDDGGIERLKTIGKLLDEKIVLEGMSTIVLKTNVSDGNYTFTTQNNGKDTVKSPAEMFSSLNIQNDLKYVDEKIRNYYGFGSCKTDEEMKTMDEEKEVVVEQPTTRRRRRNAETPEASLPVGEIPETKTDANDITADMGGDLPFDVSAFDTVPVVENQITPNKRRRRRNIEM